MPNATTRLKGWYCVMWSYHPRSHLLDDYAKLIVMLQAKEGRATCTAQSTSTPTCRWPSRWQILHSNIVTWYMVCMYSTLYITMVWCRWYRGGGWRAGTCCTDTASPGSSGCSISCRVMATFDFGYCAPSKLFWQSKTKIYEYKWLRLKILKRRLQ